jgi:hypothetical protein
MAREYVIRDRRQAPPAPVPTVRLRIQHRDTGCWLVIEGERTYWVPCARPDWSTVFRSKEHAVEVTQALGLTHKEYRITSSLSKQPT